VTEGSDYAFPHSEAHESRRLELFEQRLDPLTKRRMDRLGVGRGARCLEIGGGRGSITRWLAGVVGAEGKVVATDVEVDFLEAITEPNVQVVRHDIRTDTFPEQSFDLVHTRAVLMHVPVQLDLLERMVSWLAPGGWLLLEEADFGMWMADADPVWAAHARAAKKAFPNMSVSRGRSLLKQVNHLGLVDVAADSELDVIQPGTPLAEFYRLSLEAIAPAELAAGALTAEQATETMDRLEQPDFLCGFAYIGVWGRRP
jgi:trans-aconitate methyltransferase